MAIEFTENYFVIEGLDGTGKTTQLAMLQEHFKSTGESFLPVREPGGTVLGEAIRSILKDPSIERTPAQNVALFTVARSALAEQVILPALNRSEVVVSDRSWLTTYAYQGHGEGYDLDKIVQLTEENIGLQAMYPRAVILDADPVDLASRRTVEENEKDFFDSKGIGYFIRAREGYLDVAKRFGFAVVNAVQLQKKFRKIFYPH